MENNKSDIKIPLLSSENNEKKIDIKIAINTINALTELCKLNLLLYGLEFRNVQLTGDFRLISSQVVKNIISFLTGESIIQFGFSCRVIFNLSSQYLKADLKKLKICQFVRPLFDSDQMLQCAEDIGKTKMYLEISRFREKSANLECNITKTFVCLGATSVLGMWSTAGALIVDYFFTKSATNRQNFITFECMMVFTGVCLFSCIGGCIAAYINDQYAQSRERRIEFKYTGLYNLITNLRKWQNTDDSVNDNRKLLHDRSFSP
jgi:hypothetical protein